MTASALFNIDRIAEESVREGAYYSYAQALAHTREKIGDSNGGENTGQGPEGSQRRHGGLPLPFAGGTGRERSLPNRKKGQS